MPSLDDSEIDVLVEKLYKTYPRRFWKRMNELTEKRGIKIIVCSRKTIASLRPGKRPIGLCRLGEEGTEIYVAKHLTGHSRVYALAHELGHAILHSTKEAEFNYALYQNDEVYHNSIEEEADKYAGRLLEWLMRRDAYRAVEEFKRRKMGQ